MTKFSKEVVVKTYYSVSDIATRVGGLKAIISPFISWIPSVIELCFLYQLAKIIGAKTDDEDVEESKKLRKFLVE